MKEQFLYTNLQPKVLAIIDAANVIIERYRRQGMSLTIRQLYYRFIGFDLFPETWIDEKYNIKNRLDKRTKNTLKNYKRLGEIMNNARLHGLTDWNAIIDRTRWLREFDTHDDGQQWLNAKAPHYLEDLWRDQPCYAELWVEKDALIGVIENICSELRVPYFPTRGYMSQSEAYEAGQRIKRMALDRDVTIFHMGDHDPSGIDMSRDNEDRLLMFGRQGRIDFRRIALNWDQVQQYKPPPNPVKETDSRFKGYQDMFGDESWELDALEPEVIQELVRTNVSSIMDMPLFEANKAVETDNREELLELATNWPEVQTLLSLIRQQNA